MSLAYAADSVRNLTIAALPYQMSLLCSRRNVTVIGSPTGWHWAIARPVLPQIRACEHYRTRLLTILLRYVLLAPIIFC